MGNFFKDLFKCEQRSGGNDTTLVYEGNSIKGLFFPGKTKKAGMIYCHGGFGGTGGSSDYEDVLTYAKSGFNTYAKSGFNTFVVKYEKEGTRGIRVEIDIQEVWDAGRALREKGIEKLILMGVSRGGFVALQTMSQHFDTFDACIVHVAPTVLPSWIEIVQKLGSIPAETLRTEIIPYFNWQGDLMQSSPISHSPNLRERPILLNYGSEDKVVPDSMPGIDKKYWQGYQLYTAIINQEAPATYKVWPYGHGLAVKKDVVEFNMAWLRKALKK